MVFIVKKNTKRVMRFLSLSFAFVLLVVGRFLPAHTEAMSVKDLAREAREFGGSSFVHHGVLADAPSSGEGDGGGGGCGEGSGGDGGSGEGGCASGGGGGGGSTGAEGAAGDGSGASGGGAGGEGSSGSGGGAGSSGDGL